MNHTRDLETLVDEVGEMTEMDFAAFIECLHDVVKRNGWQRIIDRQFYEVQVDVKGVKNNSVEIKRLIDVLQDAQFQASSAESDLEDAVDKLKKLLKKW